MSIVDILEIRSLLEEYIKHNEKSNNDLNLRLNKIETRLNELPRQQINEASKEVSKIEQRISEIVGEITKVKNSNIDRLNKMETRLNELPKEQLHDLVRILIKTLKSSSI